MDLELSPPTKRVYYYLLKKKEATLRQIQEDLGFASSSAARYHIKKLVDYGLVRETFEGRYAINKIVLDDDYIMIFNSILPKSVFLASFFITSSLLIVLLMFSHPFAMEIFASLISFLASGIFLIDAVKRYLKFERTINNNKGED